MKAEDLRAKSDDELDEQLLSLKKEAVQPALSAGQRPAGGHRAHRRLRRDIARIKTIICDRRRSAVAGS